MSVAVTLVSGWSVCALIVALLFGRFAESGRGAADRWVMPEAEHREAI